MIVGEVLATKGSEVVTVDADATVASLVALLAERRIGAAVVPGRDGAIAGIVSERDVARALHAHGADVITMQVRDLMTTTVQSCGMADEISDVARVMTEGRFRHLPVVEDGTMVGIVSIGDIVKKRIDELETETAFLRDYVSS